MTRITIIDRRREWREKQYGYRYSGLVIGRWVPWWMRLIRVFQSYGVDVR